MPACFLSVPKVYTVRYGSLINGFQWLRGHATCAVCGDVCKLHSNGAILGSHALSDCVCVRVRSGLMQSTSPTESVSRIIPSLSSFPSYALCLETIIIVINIIAPVIFFATVIDFYHCYFVRFTF